MIPTFLKSECSQVSGIFRHQAVHGSSSISVRKVCKTVLGGIPFRVWLGRMFVFPPFWWNDDMSGRMHFFRVWRTCTPRKKFPEDTLPSTALQLAMTALGCTGPFDVIGLSWIPVDDDTKSDVV